MKIVAAQFNPIIGDVIGNRDKILSAIDWAQRKKVDIITFPEMALCGYVPGDLALHKTFIEEMEKQLKVIMASSLSITAIVGLIRKNPIKEEKGLLNSAAVISDGKLLGFHDKWLLPTYDLFEERRYFARGKNLTTWLIKGVRVAVLICEDMWQNAGEEISKTTYPWDPVKELISHKPDILFNLTASPFQIGKTDVRLEVCKAAVKTLNCPVIYTCQVGANGPVIFDGHSLFVDQKGLRQIAKGFEEDYLFIDLEAKKGPILFQYDLMQEVFSALKLGVHDYFKKSGQKRAVIGLSGDLDSSLVAVIAKEALGQENVLGIYMPSPMFADGYLLAKELAENLKINFISLDTSRLFKEFCFLLEPHFQEEPEDIVEENIQSRIIGSILMSFANKFRMLLLCSRNKSDLALGFCTLYGDMCGALSVIGDVLQTDCYQLACWINQKNKLIPKKILENSLPKELKHHKKDSDSLPSYALTDKVIRGYVEEYLTIEEIAKKYHMEEEIVSFIVHRIYKAEHKRRQVAPSLRVSKRSFAVGWRKPLHFSGSFSEKIY